MNAPHPSFHDGYLTAIQLNEDAVEVTLERLSGEVWLMVATGVSALQMDDFRQGNIISHVGVHCGVDPGLKALERLFPRPHTAADEEYHNAHADLLSKRAAEVEKRNATVVEISPSYGADLVIFCATVRFECLSNG